MKKALALLMVLTLATVALSGCHKDASLDENTVQALLPSLPETSESIPYGEDVSTEQYSAVLYFISEDSSSFTAANRFLPLKSGETRTENVVRILLQTAAGMSSFDFMHDNARLIDCEESGDTATINLSLDVYGNAGENQLYTLLMAVSNTALSVDGIHSVNVLINGQSPEIGGLPFGVQTGIVTGTAPAYAQIVADNEYMTSSEKATVTRSAHLYLPSATGNRLIPVRTELVFNNAGLLSCLFEKMAEIEDTDLFPLRLETSQLLSEPVLEVNENGQRIIDLQLAPDILSALNLDSADEWKLFGALTLTLTSFVPELYGLRIRIGEKLITEYAIEDTPVTFTDGIMTRRDFASTVGTYVEIFLPGEDHLLHRKNVSMPIRTARSPLAVLRSALLRNGLFEDDSVQESDILSVNIANGAANVNLSDHFYKVLLSLTDKEQNLIIYAMVNTLCAQSGIRTVSFTVEGANPAELPSGLLPGALLIANPGLIAEEEAA